MTAGPERHSADRKPGKSIMNMYAMLELAGAFSLIWHNLADSLIAVSHHSIALLSVRLASLAYMRASCVKKFFRDQHFFSSYASRGLVRAQFCIDGTAGRLLGRAERSTPGARQGRAGRREGLTAKARAELQWCPAITLQPNCVSVDRSFPVDVPITFVQFQGGAPFAMRHSPHQLISGREREPPHQGPSCNSARARGSKEDGTILLCGVLQPG